MAGAGLTAMGIESSFVCSLLILHGLVKSEGGEIAVRGATLLHRASGLVQTPWRLPAGLTAIRCRHGSNSYSEYKLRRSGTPRLRPPASAGAGAGSRRLMGHGTG